MADRPAPRGPRRSPADRVRARLRTTAGESLAAAMPSGYHRLGRVLLLRLPPRYRPYFPEIGRAWQDALGVATVLTQVGPVEGELRRPQVERLAGSETETEVREHGVRWRFDAARIMFAAGNRTERRRAGALIREGETVVDLFAGIGYFAIPAAVHGRAHRVLAVEKNPVAFHYLLENVQGNGVADRVDCILGENRTVALPTRAADRVFLGYLPDALPWVARALELLRGDGGWMHVHTVVDARDARASASRRVEAATRAVGATLLEPPRAREVKPYGPGRTHVVVDVHARTGS
ncbi:MAG: class I SAM-dependent methyltransferase family protein [Thermoplasmata archaeon]